MAKIDHSNCDHSRTPAGRKACRDSQKVQHPTSNAKANWPTDETDGAATRRARLDRLQGKLMSAADRPTRVPARLKTAEKRARIQPRRSGARVSPNTSTCIQAALHTGRGRCACGWDTLTVVA